MQGNKLFVTGATGFVGSYVLNQLIQDGFNCIALYRVQVPAIKEAEWIQGDLLDPEKYETQLKEIDTIVHVAGVVSYLKKDKNKLLFSNYLATQELVNCALHFKVKNLIFISSASTLLRSGNPEKIGIKSEGIPVFNSYYAKTKFLAELEIWRAAAEGINVCILHPSLMIGHWNWHHSSMRIFEKVKSGLNYYPPGNLGLVAVEDLAKIVSLICRNEITGQQIMVNAELWSYKDFLNEIAMNLNQNAIRSEASYWMAQILSVIDSIDSILKTNQSLITSETIKSSFTKFKYEPSSIIQSNNYHFLDIKKQIHDIVLQSSDQ